MAMQAARDAAQDDGLSGFATLDDRGRVALSKATRQALNLRPGSSLAYVVVDGSIMFFPQDEHLARLSEHAAQILDEAGLSVEDLLTTLPAARAKVMRDAYGADFMEALEREHTASRERRHDE